MTFPEALGANLPLIISLEEVPKSLKKRLNESSSKFKLEAALFKNFPVLVKACKELPPSSAS